MGTETTVKPGKSGIHHHGLAEDEHYMSRAFTLAKRGMGLTSPNPMVGCVLVRDGQVVGEGYHERFGGPHAETHAILDAGTKARGATAYVTLEPCATSFAGKKTPPCTDALVGAGIKRVVVAVRDPNPRVNGCGIAQLKSSGIEIAEGILAEEGIRLIRDFSKWILTGRPYVILQVARTRDDFVAASPERKWFTSPESRRWVHGLRAEADGILVGRITAEIDDPQLTVRDVAGHNPRRIVLDTRLRLPGDLRLFHDGAAPTMVITTKGECGVTPWGERIKVTPSAAGVDLAEVLDALGERGITSLLVEGGPTLHREFLRADLMDEVVLFTAPLEADPEVKREAGLRNALVIPEGWSVVKDEEIGGDQLVVAQPGHSLLGMLNQSSIARNNA
ncbi:MAG: bifunctional diaminohydroxyphosphoribosylaminopyrimidine deaminase/5-amino-6-(5-phosphoribosylamino)uracil reductase RibD [Fidelibacterota bacterium]|nr:MAG: bifunctional diaminohydroxyphosphoribosylaminopyrimidine deaminase/5-amino-6-(5-phosphoribosylamino)uracil reductase RibD [Candidatus Neomarinimicrobiota bacterium]